MKNYSTWLIAAIILQFITTIIHAVSLFVSLPAKNETEKQLVMLMDTYKFNLGAGFHRTMGEMMLVFSACFCLVCLLGGLLNWYLFREKIGPEVMSGVITINLIVFGILFFLSVRFAFLVPIILTGLIVLFLILSRLTLQKIR